MAFLGLFARKTHERAGFQLYTEAVRAARHPYFYADLGVPDTMDGRFDLIGLCVLLLINRLHRDGETGAALAQSVFDAMISDMDHTLREIGVGDMSVGRKVKAMWEALNGRSGAYTAPLEAGDRVALISKTRYEWTLLDYAIWFAGAATVPVYETSSAEQIGWILQDNQGMVSIAELLDTRINKTYRIYEKAI